MKLLTKMKICLNNPKEEINWNNDVDKYEIVAEAVKSGKESKCDHQDYSEIVNEKLESGGRLKKKEDTKCDDEHVNYSDISDTSTSTSIIQDGNMVHNSAPDDVSSDSNWKM